MPASKKKDLSLALLAAALVAAGGLVPLAYQYGQRRHPVGDETHVLGGPPATPTPAPTPAPGPGVDTEAAAPPPPGTEQVPAEEAESDRGPASASPTGPTLSFARAAGLHLAPDPLHLNSSAALVVDQDTGQVLARKNEQAVLPIASLTKLMTTLLVLEAGQPMDEVLTITEEDVDTMRHSRSRLRVGTRLTREEALRLALMSSENRAAHALGRAYPGGLPKLVEAMNARARALGMLNTTYVDPTGLSNRNQSTAVDLARLVAVVARNPLIREFSTTPTHLASLNGRTLQYLNSNRLVRGKRGSWDIELQKTGYIVEAGRCLTMLTQVGGHNLVMVLLDADSNGARLSDAERLRRKVVAQNGWQDDLALAKADARRPLVAKNDRDGGAKPRQAAARQRKAHKTVARKPGKTVVAKQDAAKARDSKAAKKDTGKARDAAVAKQDDSAADGAGRVRQSFAAAHPEQKS